MNHLIRTVTEEQPRHQQQAEQRHAAGQPGLAIAGIGRHAGGDQAAGKWGNDQGAERHGLHEVGGWE